ncbi:hypothetical protein SAMN05660653_01636 [Desulfonatronum thiosulfatophilum]|uniref:LapA adhesin domain-containing protein n=1 Tax=Desulfonatronum thiosulfatophilum TaxID=617002 RepID=A0A1G6CMM2_9BACT|nr:retention module-containing protein [Desulfonatronum thiosulfatophilum]SDB34005.1 hypothetical protein SAMN05660653_01636 [Desulfonatronum thiosulfatophilum]
MAVSTGTQAIGKVVILYGTVKAVAPDGTERVLGPNSIVYANERIVTESDGSVSIMLDGPPPMQVDLGRMSDVLLNEDVYTGVPEAAEVTDLFAEAELIMEALESGEEIEIDATAAGGPGGAGGGLSLVKFDVDGGEVLPTSGAETEGFSVVLPDPLEGVITIEEGEPTPPAPVAATDPDPDDPDPDDPDPDDPDPDDPDPDDPDPDDPDPNDPDPEDPDPEDPDPNDPYNGLVTLSYEAKLISPPEPLPLPRDISHVLYILENEDGNRIAVKIDDYENLIETTDPKHPEGYTDWIQGQYDGYTVTNYYIKAGSDNSGKGNGAGEGQSGEGGFFDSDGNKLTVDQLHSLGLSDYLTNNEQSFGGNAKTAYNKNSDSNPDWNGTETSFEPSYYEITITADVDNPPTEGDLVLTLSNGETITIPQGETSGSTTFTVGVDEFKGGTEISIDDDNGDEVGYDNLDTSDTATVGGPAPSYFEHEEGLFTMVFAVNEFGDDGMTDNTSETT